MRLKMFQHAHKNDFLLIGLYSWSNAESLGLNACKRVALRTGMHLYDVGLFCFVSMKQRIKAHADDCVSYARTSVKANTGHDEVISFDLL